MLKVLVSLFLTANFALSSDLDFYYKRLTGLNPNLSNKQYQKYSKLFNQNKDQALTFLVNTNSFYFNIVSEFSKQLISSDNKFREENNDAMSLIYYIIKNENNFKEVLTADYYYLPSVFFNRNLNNWDSSDFQGSDSLTNRTYVKRNPQRTNNPDLAAGVLTTNKWASIYYSAGTNRRAVKGLFNSFLCTPIEIWRDSGLSPHRIRQDVDRLPGGNPRVFKNECIKCHAPMDALAGAFAELNFEDDSFTRKKNEIDPKYHLNSNVYPDGYRTHDNSWENLIRFNHNEKFGFKAPFKGKGLNSLAKSIADSDGFRNCMSQRVYKRVCLKDIDLFGDINNELAKKLKKDNYNLKHHFKRVIEHENCR